MRSINLGRWSRFVERYFNIKGGGGLMDVDQSIRVILTLQSGNEDRYPQGWNRYGVIKQAAAVAAQNGVFQLRNPIGSGIVTVVERALLLNQAATTSQGHLSIANAQTTDFTPSGGAQLDSRQKSSPTTVYSVGTAVAPDFPSIIFAGGFSNLPGFDFIILPNNEITLLPGDAVRMVDATLNEAVNGAFFWRERSLEASELT